MAALIGCAALAAIAALAVTPGAQAQQQKAPTEAELKSKGARQMTGAEIRASRLGNTWFYITITTGAVGAVYYRDERTRVTKGTGTRRQTLWWMEGDKACEEFASIPGHTCSSVYVLNGQMHVCFEGRPTCDIMVRQLPGNAENL